MMRIRTIIHLLVGLTLLLQGFAVSAASIQPVQAQQSVEMGAMDGMPCHMDESAAPDLQKSCCDHSCPDMASCSMAAAFVTPMGMMVMPTATIELVTHSSLPVSDRTAGSLLRPPISLHS